MTRMTASGGSDLSVSVNLAAMNMSDGVLPSTVIVGVFPLKVVQSNMPTAVGVAGTTDGGTVYLREAIRTNGVAYITALPTAPRLTAQFKGLPEWIGVAWSMTLTTERGDKRFDGIDDRTLPQVSRSGTEVYDISSEMNSEVIGGACSLGIRVGTSSTIAFPFVIRGKNPLDATARAYITANVDAEFQSYAWMIAEHESMNAGSRVYNQFNAAGVQKEKPNWGAPHGWGVAQIDKGRNGDTTAEVYDWHANIAAMNATLREKRAEYRNFICMYRAVYANDASTQWYEPDEVTTNVNGVAVSAEMWGVLNCYNGKSGIPAMPLGIGTGMQSPLKFDPVTTNWVFYNWVFYTNVNDHVPRVMADRDLSEQE